MKNSLITAEAQKTVDGLKENKEKNQKPDTLVSKVLGDGTIIEMLYRPADETTIFAVFKDGKVSYKTKIMLDEKIYLPLSSKRDLLKRSVVLFPSEAANYDSTDILLAEIQTFIHKYLQVSEFYEILCSYYVLLSWLYDKFYELPYLRVLGDYGSGKSRLLKTVGSICYKPMFTSGAASVSSIFRIIDLIRGTMCIDEADFIQSDTTNEFVKILNCGFSKNAPVLRSESLGKKFEVVAYDVFGPKLLAGRMRFKDEALESRCLVEEMERRTRKDIKLNLDKDFDQESLKLRNKLLMFRFNNFNKNVDLKIEIDESVEPRLNQIIIPLLSVIDSKKEQERVKEFIKKYNEDLIEERSYSLPAETLEAYIIAVKNRGNCEPTVKEIADIFNEASDDGDSYTSKKMGWALRKLLGLKTKRTRDGYCVIDSKFNREKVEKLKRKYGIDSSELVNNVNMVEERQSQIKEVTDIFGVNKDSILDA